MDIGSREENASKSETTARPRRVSAWLCHRGRADGCRGPRAKPRPGQAARKAVCGQLRELPPQPAWPRQGPLQLDALLVPERPLHEQFRFRAGTGLVSGIGRQPLGQRVARQSEARTLVAVIAASADAGADALAIRLR